MCVAPKKRVPVGVFGGFFLCWLLDEMLEVAERWEGGPRVLFIGEASHQGTREGGGDAPCEYWRDARVRIWLDTITTEDGRSPCSLENLPVNCEGRKNWRTGFAVANAALTGTHQLRRVHRRPCEARYNQRDRIASRRIAPRLDTLKKRGGGRKMRFPSGKINRRMGSMGERRGDRSSRASPGCRKEQIGGGPPDGNFLARKGRDVS